MEMVNVDMINHFTYTDSKSSIKISTGLKASDDIAIDLLQLTGIGKETVKKYVESSKINKLNLKTFWPLRKAKKLKVKVWKNEQAGEIQILKRALMIRNRHEVGKDQ